MVFHGTIPSFPRTPVDPGLGQHQLGRSGQAEERPPGGAQGATEHAKHGKNMWLKQANLEFHQENIGKLGKDELGETSSINTHVFFFVSFLSGVENIWSFEQ